MAALPGVVRFATVVVLLAAAIARGAPPVRISSWYWLNSAPRQEWDRDFRAMRKLGFTHAVLCWGYDPAAFSWRQADTRLALDLCRRAGLGAYLVIWIPAYNGLPKRPEFLQVDGAGNQRASFDVFNPEWRGTQWNSYLRKIVMAYHAHPAFAGYVFDDSFGVGAITQRAAAQKGDREAERTISYSAAVKKIWRGEPPVSHPDPAWPRWVEARMGWWEQWARETVATIREVDRDRLHEVYLEDHENILNPVYRDRLGLDFARVAKHFDAVCAYTTAAWNSPGSGERAAAHTRAVLDRTRAMVGADKKLIGTFWAFNADELGSPGPAKLPTVEQLRLIANAALDAGLRHLDFYGYRIGDWNVNEREWHALCPGAAAEYPLTRQFSRKFLWDRPEVHKDLRKLLRELARR